MVLASVTSSITSFIGTHGVYAVFVLMAIDAVFPAASEVVLFYAGALAAGAFPTQHISLFGTRIGHGPGAFLALAAAATLGYLVGALGGWAAGVYGGRRLVERHGRLLHLGPHRLERAERWFEQWGLTAVFLGRIVPVVRSFVSIPAGLFAYPLPAYTGLTLAGSAIWSFALAGIGYAVGANWDSAHSSFRYADYLAVALVVVIAARLLWKRRAPSARTRGGPS